MSEDQIDLQCYTERQQKSTANMTAVTTVTIPPVCRFCMKSSWTWKWQNNEWLLQQLWLLHFSLFSVKRRIVNAWTCQFHETPSADTRSWPCCRHQTAWACPKHSRSKRHQIHLLQEPQLTQLTACTNPRFPFPWDTWHVRLWNCHKIRRQHIFLHLSLAQDVAFRRRMPELEDIGKLKHEEVVRNNFLSGTRAVVLSCC